MTSDRLRLGLYLGWMVAGAVLVRFWDLTVRFERVLVWTAVFAGLYALSTWVLRRRRTRPDHSWSDVGVWLGIVVTATALQMVFPRVSWGSSTVQTVALLRVLDVVLPLWILHRGVYAAGEGATRAAFTLAMPLWLLATLWWVSVRMPGASHVGALPPLSPLEAEVRDRGRRHLFVLADSIGSRGFRRQEEVVRATEYLEAELTALGYEVESMRYVASGQEHRNLQVTLPGSDAPEQIVVVGAHYDTYDLTPGADDNATGAAAVLELARLMRDERPARTVRFVLFGTEEPPFFNTDRMGSRVYARASREAGERIVGMLSLEMLGYFRDAPRTQRYPPPMGLFYPDRGNFVAFIGNPASGRLLRAALSTFRETTAFPSEGVVSSAMVPGIELSDHASFWRSGFPAIMVSDTGPFRNTHYHLDSDLPGELDFDRMARVIVGIHRVLSELVGATRSP